MTNAVEIVSIPIPETEPVADPFASDVFVQHNGASAPERRTEASVDTTEPTADLSPEPLAAWASGLPKVSAKLLDSSLAEQLPGELPYVLAEAIGDALSEVVLSGPERVHCQLGSIAECDLSVEAAASTKAGNLSIGIAFGPTESYASMIVGGSFVRWIIDSIFGPSGFESSNRISAIETAIAEFLAVRIVANINEKLGDEFFSVIEASLTPAELFEKNEAGVKARIEVQTDSVSRSLQVLISNGFLAGLKTAFFDPEVEDRRAERMFRTLRSIPLRAQIGTTRMDAATLSFLEPGDVVVVERSDLEWDDASPAGELRIFAGAGDNFVLTGDIVTDKDAEPGRIQVLVKDIFSREAVDDSHAARIDMEDKAAVTLEENEMGREPDEDDGVEQLEDNEISASLENLQLRLRIELAGRKISLREINSLREGQVIDLGRGPTDSVNLVADDGDEPVAVGELVDIDGRLGVRLTKVFV